MESLLVSDGRVRRARRGDLRPIVQLWKRLQEVNSQFDPRLLPRADAAEWFSEYLHDEEDSDHVALFVAEVAGEIVGYAMGQILRRPTLESGDCGYIADLYVHDDFRRRGFGRTLAEELFRWFAAHGLHAIEVQVVTGNPASLAFWRKMGFADFLSTLRHDASVPD